MSMEPDPYVEPYTFGRRAHWFTRFLWFCAGADPQLLARCPHSDQVKYQGLGGVVLATASLATFSGGYAFYMVFLPRSDLALSPVQQSLDPWTLAQSIFFGAVWGLVIFNLDRFVVSSTGKGDGTAKISWDEFKGALPRMFLAITIALTISKPLEIRVMESEIEAQLELEQQRYRLELDDQTETTFAKRRDEAMLGLRNAAERIQKSNDYFEGRRLEIQRQREKLEAEAEGASASGLPGRGPAWQDKKDNLDRMEADLERDRASAQAKVSLDEAEQARYEAQRARVEQDLAENREFNARQANNLDGLVKRIELAHTINPLIGYALMALFIAIEIAPILFKLMLEEGAYDLMEENLKRLAAAREGIQIDDVVVLPDHSGAEKRTPSYHQHAAYIARERKRYEAQQRLEAQVVDEYEARTRDRIRETPDAFLREPPSLVPRSADPDGQNS